MSALVDMTGRTYGKLLIIERGPNGGRKARWWCKCRCGKMTLKNGIDLRSGKTRSCGCLRREVARKLTPQRNRERSTLGIDPVSGFCSNAGCTGNHSGRPWATTCPRAQQRHLNRGWFWRNTTLKGMTQHIRAMGAQALRERKETV